MAVRKQGEFRAGHPVDVATIAVAAERPQQAQERHAGTGFWRRYRRQPAALIGSALLVALALIALGADRIAFYDPFATSDEVLRPPSAAHPLGTDDLGRDLFSGVVHGARVSLLVGLVSALTATVIGVAVGGVAGWSTTR